MTKTQIHAQMAQIKRDYLDEKNKNPYSNFEEYLLMRLIVATEAVNANTHHISKNMPLVYSD